MAFGVGNGVRVGVGVGDGIGMGVDLGLAVGIGDGASLGVAINDGIGDGRGLGVGVGDGAGSGMNHSRMSAAICLIPVGFEMTRISPKPAIASITMISGTRSHFGRAVEPKIASANTTTTTGA